MTKNIIIGVTGHRNISMSDKTLIKAVTKEIRTLREAEQGANFILLTGMAEGADRMVAKIAMKELGAKIIAVLAVPEEHFLMDFADAKSKREFKTLLAKAEYTITAPLLSKRAWQTYTPSRNNQYAWIGAFIAQHSNYLIAIWDGQPARGRGGTAEVVRWFKGGRIPKLMLKDAGKFAKAAGLKKPTPTAVKNFLHIKV